MAGDNGTEIDLYDNIDEDFVQECTDLTELYDDVIAPASSDPPVTSSSLIPKASSGVTPHSGRRVAAYVGNLTWWTTDVDLLEATNSIGVTDVSEIKFHENRQNGQSKGFCVMVFGSDSSMRITMEKLPKLEIHGQNPVVTYYTKHNLNIFEKAAGGDAQPQTRTRSDESVPSKVSSLAGTSSAPPSTRLLGTSTSTGNRIPPPLMATPTMPASLGFSLRNNTSLMGQAMPNVRHTSTIPSLQQALVTQNLQSSLNANGQLGQLPINFTPSTNVLMAPGGMPSVALAANASALLPSAFNLPNSIPTSLAGTNAHVNPNFLTQPTSLSTGLSNAVQQPNLMQLNTTSTDATSRSQFDHYGRPVIHTYTPSSGGKLSDSEFEDILQRNKTVSSSAINRAVQDAANGDYASAIETLVTAISLIKQSKIASDERCRILINSLQDTLHGIETKSYSVKGSSSSSRRRRRSYSDSGSDGGMEGGYNTSTSGAGSRSRHRDRSRRSRSRDRHDRHDRHDRRRHSRDRVSGSGSSYYGVGSNLSLSSSTGIPSGVATPDIGNPAQVANTSGLIGSSDRYRDNRYRH